MRYFLSQDNSCNWYLVPADRRKEWSDWNSIDDDDPRGWTAPDFAIPLNGSPSRVTFTDPKENG